MTTHIAQGHRYSFEIASETGNLRFMGAARVLLFSGRFVRVDAAASRK